MCVQTVAKSRLSLAWKSGSGNRWSVGLAHPSGEEIVIRAAKREEAEAAARAGGGVETGGCVHLPRQLILGPRLVPKHHPPI